VGLVQSVRGLSRVDGAGGFDSPMAGGIVWVRFPQVDVALVL